MSDLENRVALITGAAGNLGKATVAVFRDAGASLALVAHSEGALQELFPDLADSSDHLLAGGIDLAEPSAVEDRFGRIDVLVNTVGTFKGGKPVHEDDIETWDSLYRVNVRTAVLTTQAVIPIMMGQGSGRVVNVASRNALEGVAKVAAYSATKSAVIRLTESLAEEAKSSGVGVNCVLPSTIDTPENREAMPDADFSKWVKPEAIADAILFLSSDRARAITGAALPVYGLG